MSVALIRPIILCGGSGTRLWPVSRESFPKQFIPFIGNKSTFQETLLRFKDRNVFDRPLIIANKNHRFMLERQMEDIGIEADIILEPMPRDSGPAILAASFFIEKNSPNSLALVVAADHVFQKPNSFKDAVISAKDAASKGFIVTFGINPSCPATAYGYIEPGLAIEKNEKIQNLVRFVEKPDAETAQSYIEKGYFWNSGNFLFLPKVVIEEYEKSDPQSLNFVRQAFENAKNDLDIPVLEASSFLNARKISFDYAVMENTKHAAVIAGDFGWSDVGGWGALWDISPQDEEKNAKNGEVRFFDSRENYVSTEDQLVSLLGVQNLIVVATKDAILVADKSRAGEVKQVVDALKSEGLPQASQCAKMFRPWGWYQTLELQERFQVKRIVVYPNGKLSLQKHHHRAEHWVVVKGTARVTVEDKITELTENQSTYIPLGAVHRLENPGKIPVEIIEVQTGAYLGEDDIIRLEDVYERK